MVLNKEGVSEMQPGVEKTSVVKVRITLKSIYNSVLSECLISSLVKMLRVFNISFSRFIDNNDVIHSTV